MPQLASVFEPLPAQYAFLQSTAKVRGYGGAMGGGKSRALCEDVLDEALNYPGLRCLVCRQSHTSIVETTKKTMLEQVLPYELVEAKKESQGEDWVRLRNGSTIHFVGLDDPVRWFSSEVGKLVFDEAHEISEDTVVKLATRLRQKGMRHRITIGFNPENPGHWLYRWLILGAAPTDYGYRKEQLFVGGSSVPYGDCEFFFARATDNVHLDRSYVEQTLAGLPPLLKRRYLDGEWLYVSGRSFFDAESLLWHQERLERPLLVGRTEGDPGDPRDRLRVVRDSGGPLWVWAAPVRESEDEETGRVSPAHRYVVSVDVSSGTSNDYSAIEVFDIDAFEQVAELQAMMDTDLLALEAFRLACIYNGAVLAPEITGGWGATVDSEIKRLLPRYKGAISSKPRSYTRKIWDRLSRQWTDRTGWDTTTAMRAKMLDTLERVIREREVVIRSDRLLAELGAFVWSTPKMITSSPKAEAQPGMNDDLVVAMAIAVTVALERPRELRHTRVRRQQPQFAATGY